MLTLTEAASDAPATPVKGSFRRDVGLDGVLGELLNEYRRAA